MQLHYPVIIGKLCRRFGLTVGNPEVSTTFGPLTPITDADAIAWEPESATATVTLSGTGVFAVFTVPAGERWILDALSGVANSPFAGTYYIGLTRALKIGDTTTVRCEITDLITNQFRWRWSDGTIIWLFPGDRIDCEVATWTVEDSLSARMAYRRVECSSG